MYTKRSRKLNQQGGRAKRKSKKRTNLWAQAFKKARKELNIRGFQPLKKGTELYNRTKKIHLNLKGKQ
jgi:hypothetical protein